MKSCEKCLYYKGVSGEQYCYIIKKDIENFNIANECKFYDEV